MKAAHDAWVRADAECSAHYGVEDADSQAETAMWAASAARDLLMETPAPNLLAIHKKLEIARDHALSDAELDPVLADVRRFADEGR